MIVRILVSCFLLYMCILNHKTNATDIPKVSKLDLRNEELRSINTLEDKIFENYAVVSPIDEEQYERDFNKYEIDVTNDISSNKNDVKSKKKIKDSLTVINDASKMNAVVLTASETNAKDDILTNKDDFLENEESEVSLTGDNENGDDGDATKSEDIITNDDDEFQIEDKEYDQADVSFDEEDFSTRRGFSKLNHKTLKDIYSRFTFSRNRSEPKVKDSCLTGYMTDVQNWVDEFGNLSTKLGDSNYIDVSTRPDPVTDLSIKIQSFVMRHRQSNIRYLSLAKCFMNRVPKVFNMTDGAGRSLYSTVEFLTLYGNNFIDIQEADSVFGENMNASNSRQLTAGFKWPGSSEWAAGFSGEVFKKLKQLDLRRCSIMLLTDEIFGNMPHLEALYLGENRIAFISTNAFRGLKNLMHLDMSRNQDGTDMYFEHAQALKPLTNLMSLDFSMTTMQHKVARLFSYTKKLQRLSICYTGITQLPPHTFKETNLKILDVSGNNGIFNMYRPLMGLEKKLQYLYAREIGLKNLEVLLDFNQLRILNLEANEINALSIVILKTWKKLNVLNLSINRIGSWFGEVFSNMPELEFLSLTGNNLNMISEQMITDLQNISYVGISDNLFVCNCQTREFFELAYRNQNTTIETPDCLTGASSDIFGFRYHTGYEDFNQRIARRKRIKLPARDEELPLDFEADFQLFDFDQKLYTCLSIADASVIPFSEVKTCAQTRFVVDLDDRVEEGRRRLLYLIILPGIILPVMFFCFIFRRNLRYFCITMRNSATLSLINKEQVVDDGTIFNYDVFVSYCNEDRNWVLDQLLPNVERDCNVSICLHERDFQVGLSILENIVACMDRSRLIMLVLSQQFLKSQWCQFEMHLAQHRLLETRREDLVLVLLEDIPRRLRPTTLHYLMLTKTYIIWPKTGKHGDEMMFWKRLTRSIMTREQKIMENVSLA